MKSNKRPDFQQLMEPLFIQRVFTQVMPGLDSRVKKFGELFRGRLDNERLQFAIDYVDYNETGLAFETICDYLSEEDVPISQAEYHLAVSLRHELKMAPDDITLQHLHTLIKR
ncbi:MafI family immunity protein [Cedecea neteri]|uniref:MafI family immunity protein n=1 Tax=Cedecea neteri TaxID=158822 RepID=UPI002AA6E1AB|nr:MafI family immunity protein [Cedecea neteri]WPU21487.1 MafI family immunity protein [Cedecea neteri]